jgi:hypothetical protein
MRRIEVLEVSMKALTAREWLAGKREGRYGELGERFFRKWGGWAKERYGCSRMSRREYLREKRRVMVRGCEAADHNSPNSYIDLILILHSFFVFFRKQSMFVQAIVL